MFFACSNSIWVSSFTVAFSFCFSGSLSGEWHFEVRSLQDWPWGFLLQRLQRSIVLFFRAARSPFQLCSANVDSVVFLRRIPTTQLRLRPNGPSILIAWPGGPGPRTRRTFSGPTGWQFISRARRMTGPWGLKDRLGTISLARWARLCKLLALWAGTQELRILPHLAKLSRQDTATVI